MMEDALDIGEVAKTTGLTLRALRFYEARGLVSPLRTGGGRRVYGRGELARLNAAVALKRAGFSLAQIGKLLAGRSVDLGRLVALQLDALDAQASQIAEARTLLSSVQSRIDRGEPIDVATLCSLIRNGDNVMEKENWQAVTDRFLSDDAKADFAEARPKMDPDFDQAAYSAQWTDLANRIEAALPMDPASDQARTFYAEWNALLAPFTAIATPAMMQGVGRMYDRMGEWSDQQKPPFSPAVWDFIKSVGPAPTPGR